MNSGITHLQRIILLYQDIIPFNAQLHLYCALLTKLKSDRLLARQKESRIEEGHLLADHVHMLISIPPKYQVSSVIGFIKGKSAICIARNFMGKRRNFVGECFWARGFYVSTVGLDEDFVREYIKHQEKEDQRIEQLLL